MAKAVSGVPMIQGPKLLGGVESPFHALAKSALKLNAASDELASVVEHLETSLKKLNLGVTAWVDIDDEADHEAMCFRRERLGYIKWGKKWGIAISVVEGELGGNPYNNDTDTWLFADAPRELRIKAADHIPHLIEALNKASEALATKLLSKASEVGILTHAITGQTVGEK